MKKNNKSTRSENSTLEFISTVAHQLRDPITSQLWFLQALLSGAEGQLAPGQKTLVENIYHSARHMDELFSVLLKLSKIETGKLVLALKPVDLSALVQRVFVQYRQAAKAKKVKLLCKNYIKKPVLAGDEEFLWQVLQNLVSNAISYSLPKKTVTVELRVKSGQCICRVHDFGLGITPGEKKKIFERFYRGNGARKLVPQGSGIGLALAHELVEAWGGRLWLSSSPRGGTSFYISIPQRLPAVPERR